MIGWPTALEIRTKKLRAKVAHKFTTLKSWGPHSKVGGHIRDFDRPSIANFTNFAIFRRVGLKL